MNGYEKIIDLMRQQGAVRNLPAPRLAEMAGVAECDVGNMKLEREDFLVAEHLKGNLMEGDTVLIQRVSEEKYAIIEKLVEL